MNLTYLKQIYDYRNLIITLAAKEIKIKYKSAALGWLWSILNPLLMMLIFSVIFTFIIRIEIPRFPIFLLSALLPWFFLSLSLTSTTTSIVDNASLIKQVNFPHEIIPISVVAANLFNFLISLVLLLVFFLFLRIYPTLYSLYLPLIVLLQFVFVVGISLLCCALHTMFRDVKYAIELILLIWFYATPIFYPLSFVPEKMRFFFYFNPLTLFVGIYRDILLYQKPPVLWQLACVGLLSFAFLYLGLFIFFRYKKFFVDIT